MVNGTIMIISLLVIGTCGVVDVSGQAIVVCTIVFLSLWVAAYVLLTASATLTDAFATATP